MTRAPIITFAGVAEKVGTSCTALVTAIAAPWYEPAAVSTVIDVFGDVARIVGVDPIRQYPLPPRLNAQSSLDDVVQHEIRRIRVYSGDGGPDIVEVLPRGAFGYESEPLADSVAHVARMLADSGRTVTIDAGNMGDVAWTNKGEIPWTGRIEGSALVLVSDAAPDNLEVLRRRRERLGAACSVVLAEPGRSGITREDLTADSGRVVPMVRTEARGRWFDLGCRRGTGENLFWLLADASEVCALAEHSLEREAAGPSGTRTAVTGDVAVSVVFTAANGQLGSTLFTPGATNLVDQLAARNLHAIVHWATDVTKALKVGYASVAYHDAKGVGAPIPVCVAVGGWTLPEPCCAGHLAPDPSEVGVMACPEAASTWWRCGGCGDLVEPTIWASMPLLADNEPGAKANWLLPAPEDVAAAADRGWDLWVAELRSCGEADARHEADLIGQLLLASAAGDVEVMRKRTSSTTDLFAGPAGRPETAASARWGTGADGTGHLELGFHEPVPVPSRESGRHGSFDVKFATVTTVSVSAATATRLWPCDVEAPSPAELTPAWVRDTWRRLGADDPPEWMSPLDDQAIAAIAAELNDRRKPSRHKEFAR